MKGSDAHESVPRSERSRISGCDPRKAAKSGSSLDDSFNSADLGTGDTRIHVT